MKRRLALALSLVLSLSFSFGAPATAVDWTTKVDASVLQAATLGDTEFIAYIGTSGTAESNSIRVGPW